MIKKIINIIVVSTIITGGIFTQTTHASARELNWAALRRCESGGNYRSVSRSGKYRGAYQFDQRTWNDVASGAAQRRDLINRRPNEATTHEQDYFAQLLYRSRGRKPWPHCGRKL